ncbi:UDP-N-acetylmuramoyl-L-alanyl-D-glutamate--2,6-diaminopimelate ligase [Candidatus Omnitrophota bacterium]
MRLKKILENLNGIKKIEGRTSLDIKGIVCDSKAVKSGYLFIAIKGSRFNGVDFVNEAIDRGAYAVMLGPEHKSIPTFKRGSTFIYMSDARLALSEVSRAFYGDISNRMQLIGVTGTNGKTTATYLLEGLFKAKGKEVGIIGTVNYRFGNRLIPAVNTTPGVLDLYSLLSSMEKEAVKNCILEVSSHSLEQGRVETLRFDIAVFTNITNEHLDYHKNLENYLMSKMKLFTKIKLGGYAIINNDDPCSERIAQEVKLNKKAKLITYGIEKKADVCAKDIEFSFEGLRFKLCAGSVAEIDSRLIGRHNVYNILASAACGIAMGMSVEEITSGIEKVTSLPGRLERIDCGQDFLAFVDYAHTENGMENALKALRELKPKRLLTVFGCGGDRDRAKRPKMGNISSELSDKIFITSDNPRSEEPIDIINEITKGISNKKNNYVIEIDRFKAIRQVLEEARPGDIVLVAGKGHETYQIFKNITLPFDDREVVKKILKEKRLCLRSEIS